MSEMNKNVKTWECGKENESDVIATLENGTLTISGKGEMKNYNNINVPWRRESIIKIIIREGIETIGDNAFYDSLGLSLIFFNSNSMVGIGEFAFRGCTALESIIIPDNVKSIGRFAFSDCTSLQNVVLPNTVEIIGSYVFQRCTSLRTFVLPKNLDKVSNYMFSGCTNLFSITISKNIKILYSDIFQSCTDLCEIINEREVPQIISYDLMRVSSNLSLFNKPDFKLFVPKSAINAYKNAPIWKNFKNIIPIEDKFSAGIKDTREIDEEILKLDSQINELISEKEDLLLKKAMFRGVVGNPKHVAEFMSLFNQRDGLKYLTHDIDGSDDFKYEEVLSMARKVCTENFEALEIPNTLKNLLNQFIFEKDPHWKSYDKKYVESEEKLGWSANGMEEVKSGNLHPIKQPQFKDVINNFKRLTRVESPYLESIVDKVFGNKGFELNKKDISKADFYTHVEEFMMALETIFSEIEKRSDTDDKKKIAVSYLKATSGDYFVRKIVITHLNSYPTRNDKDALLKEWVSFEKGSMAKIAEHLKGYCHWSVETKVDGEPVRVNILREKETEPFGAAEFENVDGFTHILTFYYQS